MARHYKYIITTARFVSVFPTYFVTSAFFYDADVTWCQLKKSKDCYKMSLIEDYAFRENESPRILSIGVLLTF